MTPLSLGPRDWKNIVILWACTIVLKFIVYYRFSLLLLLHLAQTLDSWVCFLHCDTQVLKSSLTFWASALFSYGLIYVPLCHDTRVSLDACRYRFSRLRKSNVNSVVANDVCLSGCRIYHRPPWISRRGFLNQDLREVSKVVPLCWLAEQLQRWLLKTWFYLIYKFEWEYFRFGGRLLGIHTYIVQHPK